MACSRGLKKNKTKKKKTTETGVQSTDIIYAIYIDTRKLREQ